MPYERVRNLSPEVLEKVVPLLPPPSTADSTWSWANIRAGMAKLKEGKDRALNGPWVHLRDSVVTENVPIPMRDGHQVELRVYKPSGGDSSKMRPAYYSLHGGAFIAGSNDTEDLINRQLAHEAELTVFSLDYRLAPEHDVVDIIFNDAEDGLEWVYAHASEYGSDVQKGLLVGGTSVGGCLSTMLAYRSPSLGIPVKGVLLRQPAFMFGDMAKKEWKPHLKSLEENADAPLLNKVDVINTEALLAIPREKAVDPWNFPIFSPDLSRFPPAYLVGAGVDPVIDQTILFNKLLNEAGVKTKFKLYEGMPHGFHGFHMLKEAKEEMKETAEGVKWLLREAELA